MFRRPSVRYGRTPEPETPYQKAAQVWDERIGSARVQARNWRLMAFGSLILSAGLAVSLVWQSVRGTVTPWVVQVDHLGQAQAVAPATPTISRPRRRSPITSRASSRISGDCRSIRSCCANNGCAPTTSPPIAAPPRSTILPAPTIPSPISARCRSRSRSPASSAPRRLAFRVAWIQRAYENGSLAATERWTAILTVVIQTPRDADRLRKNPLGIYVNAINWSKELGQ